MQYRHKVGSMSPNVQADFSQDLSYDSILSQILVLAEEQHGRKLEMCDEPAQNVDLLPETSAVSKEFYDTDSADDLCFIQALDIAELDVTFSTEDDVSLLHACD